MFVFISVPPMMMIQNQLVGAAIGQNITLECTSEAFPKSINFWMRSSSKNDSIISAGKYKELQLPFSYHLFDLALQMLRTKILDHFNTSAAQLNYYDVM